MRTNARGRGTAQRRALAAAAAAGPWDTPPGREECNPPPVFGWRRVIDRKQCVEVTCLVGRAVRGILAPRNTLSHRDAAPRGPSRRRLDPVRPGRRVGTRSRMNSNDKSRKTILTLLKSCTHLLHRAWCPQEPPHSYSSRLSLAHEISASDRTSRVRCLLGLGKNIKNVHTSGRVSLVVGSPPARADAFLRTAAIAASLPGSPR